MKEGEGGWAGRGKMTGLLGRKGKLWPAQKKKKQGGKRRRGTGLQLGGPRRNAEQIGPREKERKRKRAGREKRLGLRYKWAADWPELASFFFSQSIACHDPIQF